MSPTDIYEDERNWWQKPKTWVFSAIIAIIFILFFSFVGCERIDAGHVGLKVNMAGGDRGISKTKYIS